MTIQQSFLLALQDIYNYHYSLATASILFFYLNSFILSKIEKRRASDF